MPAMLLALPPVWQIDQQSVPRLGAVTSKVSQPSAVAAFMSGCG